MTEPSAKGDSSEDASSDEKSGESRADRLRRIREQIEDGTYDTEERMDEALRRMLGRLESEES